MLIDRDALIFLAAAFILLSIVYFLIGFAALVYWYQLNYGA